MALDQAHASASGLILGPGRGLNGLVVRLAEPSDWPALSELFESVFGQVRIEAAWRHKYRPPSPASAGQVVVFESASGAPVGHLGYLIWPGVGPHGSTEVAQVMDVMVHSHWRGWTRGLGQSVFQLLVGGLQTELKKRSTLAFAYGFAGLRPFRLGRRLNVYRPLHGCWAENRPPRAGTLVLKPIAWSDRLVEMIRGTARPAQLLGPDWTSEYLVWRFRGDRSPYVLWANREHWAITRQWHDGQMWCLASSGGEGLSALPIAVQVWRRQVWVDRGYGRVENEPQMIASEVSLGPDRPGWSSIREGYCEPWSTDVF